MGPTRFDAITRSLGETRSRRTVLGTLGAAALGAIGLAGARSGADAAPGGNSACAAFCAQVFGDTQAAGQCTSQAAQGQGLCAQCGPAAQGTGLTLCGQTCAECCADGDCPGGQICRSGTCDVNCATSATGTPCANGTGACLGGTCYLVYPCASGAYGVVPNSGGVNACICGYGGSFNYCASPADCPSGNVCIGNGDHGYCQQGCPA